MSYGCWWDDATRALTNLEKDIDESFGTYLQRTDPLKQCKNAALGRNFPIFALQDGGECWGTDQQKDPYRHGGSNPWEKFGKVNDVSCEPKGGALINHVYEIKTGKLLIIFFSNIYNFNQHNC